MATTSNKSNNAKRETVFIASFFEADARAAAIAAVKAAGVGQEETRAEYVAGQIARLMNLCPAAKNDGRTRDTWAAGRTAALAVMALSGYKADDASDKRRNLAQERAYAAARQAWSRMLKLAGVASAEKRGTKSRKAGAKNAGTVRDKSGAPITIPAIVIPKVKGINDAVGYMAIISAHLRKFEAANSAGLTGDEGTVIRDAIEAFASAINKLTIK